VGLAVCVLGCASAWKPPPEPPPPPPFVEAPPKPDRLEWDATARRISRCGPVAFTVPADLTAHVRMNGPKELTIVPPGLLPGSPPGGALMARIHDPPASNSSDDDDEGAREDGLVRALVFIFEKVADRVTLGHEFLAIARLHEMASGLKLEEIASQYDGGTQDTVEIRIKDDLVEATYVIGDETWRLYGVSDDHCAIMAIERVAPNATHHFDEMVKQMRAVAHSFGLVRF